MEGAAAAAAAGPDPSGPVAAAGLRMLAAAAAAGAGGGGSSTTVHLKLSPTRLEVRHYWKVLGVATPIVRRRIFSAPLRASLRLALLPLEATSGAGKQTVCVVDDGADNAIALRSDQPEVLYALYAGLLRQKMGGRRSGGALGFAAKVTRFNADVGRAVPANRRRLTFLQVPREDVLGPLRRLSTSEWQADWQTTFVHGGRKEESSDMGGPTRELISLAAEALFGGPPADEQPAAEGPAAAVRPPLFLRLGRPAAGLCHPNPAARSGAALADLGLAGKLAAKCLLDTAHGQAGRLCPVHFTAAFYKTMLDLPVHFNDFENDDPSLYTSQVNWILQTDQIDRAAEEALGEPLTFSVEPVSGPIVDLRPGGSALVVTDQNKHAVGGPANHDLVQSFDNEVLSAQLNLRGLFQYLLALARYRLGGRKGQRPAGQAEAQVEAFVKGFGSVLDMTLLEIFDERELELLLCGTPAIDAAALRAAVTLEGFAGRAEFGDRAIGWFWAAVDGLTQHELARLLQFMTGSSVLPFGNGPGGGLRLRVTADPSRLDALPTAHTCFNQLCLPAYSSAQKLEQLLYIAVTEGYQGFSMA